MSRWDWSKPRSEPLPAPRTPEEWARCLADPWWRLCSGVLYKILIKGDDGQESDSQIAPFLPNINQLRFFRSMHYRNVILKARQLGFSTAACIYGLDHAIWVPNQRCGIICQDLDTASSMLRDKVKLAYEQLPDPIRERMPLKRESAKELVFGHNNSSIKVATSMRGTTPNFLHISELGKIARQYPNRAREIITGALPAVPQNGIATIESTAEGQEGEFFNIATRAEALAQMGEPLAKGQFKFHFFPWFLEPGYVADPRRNRISLKMHEYFDGLEVSEGINLSMPQRAWYVQKLENDFSGDIQKMKQEMPSTSSECWERSTEGTYLTTQLTAARTAGRIGNVPYLPGLPVHTCWDIGAGDGTGIWCWQQVGLASHFIRYIEGWGQGYSHYVNQLGATGWVFGRMLLPHDAMQQRQLVDTIGAPLNMLQDLRKDWSWEIVPRVHDFQAGIETLRKRFPEAWFDEAGCKEGLDHLALYRKKFNTRLGVYTDDPEKHDGHSEAPDALRQWAQGFHPSHATPGAKKPLRRRTTGMTA